MRPRPRAVDRDMHDVVRPSPASSAARSASPSSAMPSRSSSRAIADDEPLALDGGERAVTGDGLEALRAAGARARARVAALHDRLGERVLALALGGRRRAAGARPRRSPSAVTMTATTSGSPRVSVPVLSSTTVSSDAACSSATAFLNRMPRLAPRPVPTMIAVGVARPSASGQVMTTTRDREQRARPGHRPADDEVPDQEGAERRRRSATRTSQKAARSASRCAGSLGVLRLLDELDDLRECGVGADGGRAGPKRAVAC